MPLSVISEDTCQFTFFPILIHNRQLEAVKKGTFLWEVLISTHLVRDRLRGCWQIAYLLIAALVFYLQR